MSKTIIDDISHKIDEISNVLKKIEYDVQSIFIEIDKLKDVKTKKRSECAHDVFKRIIQESVTTND